MVPRLGPLASWTLLLTIILSGSASANSGGITGFSGKQQGRFCNACHGGGVAPTVQLSGPMEVAPGETATFRFDVHSQSAQQTHAGFNAAVSDGLIDIIQGQGARRVASVNEITHTTPKMNVDGVASWEFTWKAPDAPGPQTIFAAGNSVNRTGNTAGDAPARATFVVDVGGDTPTPSNTPSPSATETPVPDTPTATPSDTATPSPTMTPTNTPRPTRTPTPTAAPCVGDCSADGTVTIAEIITGVRIGLGLRDLNACEAADVDRNQTVTIDDLIRTVRSAVFGCTP